MAPRLSCLVPLSLPFCPRVSPPLLYEGSLERPPALEGLQIWNFKNVNTALTSGGWKVVDKSFPFPSPGQTILRHTPPSRTEPYLPTVVTPLCWLFLLFVSFFLAPLPKIKHFTFQSQPPTPKILTQALLHGGAQVRTLPSD